MKKIIFVLLVILVFAVGCTRSAGEEKTNKTDMINEEISSGQGAKEYSIQDVAQHNKQSDCWLVIEGEVYDATKFIASHPGGKAILEGCGADATLLFENRPMGSGTPHSGRARDMLKDYYIGGLR